MGKILFKYESPLQGCATHWISFACNVEEYFNASVYYNQRTHNSSDLKVLLKFLGLKIKIKGGNLSSSCL